MKPNVVTELDDLKKMIQNWKKCYLNWATPDGDNMYIVDEFRGLLVSNLYPYVQRLYETEHLTKEEARKFISYCEGQAKALEDILKLAGSTS